MDVLDTVLSNSIEQLKNYVSQELGETGIDVMDYDDALMPNIHIETIKDKSMHIPARCLLLCELMYDANFDSVDEKTAVVELTKMLESKNVIGVEVTAVVKRIQHPVGIFKFGETTYVISRGSTTAIDFVTNLYVGMTRAFQSEIHSGFYLSYASKADAVQRIISESKNVVFSGHSSGGSVSAIHAAKYFSTTGIEPTLITFGAPRISNKNFQEFILNYTNHTRFVTDNDIVPDLPRPTVVMETLKDYFPWLADKHVTLNAFSKAQVTKVNAQLNEEPEKLDVAKTAAGIISHRFDNYMKSFLRHVEKRAMDCCLLC